MSSLGAAIRARVHELRYGFLLLPLAIAVAIALLAPLLVEIDHRWADGDAAARGETPEAARTLLTTIAGAILTVAGLTFSITIVTLQLVSQQFSPRALRRFLGDRLNQVVIGVFLGTFLYAVLVLRAVEGVREGFVPPLAVATAVLLTLASIVLLLVFIHHMAQTIQASSIAWDIAKASIDAIDAAFADGFGHGTDEDPDELVRRWDAELPRHPVRLDRPGYLRALALEGLEELAGPAREVRAIVHAAPGDFVTPAEPLVEYWAPERDEELESALARATSVRSERDQHQDDAFGLRQLADIALRALSPGVNDPTTAVTCVGYLRAVLELLVAQPVPVPVRRYAGAPATLVVTPRRFEDYVDTAFLELSRSAASDRRVAAAALDAVGAVVRAAGRAGATAHVPTLVAAAEDLEARALEAAQTARDRQDVLAARARVDDAVRSCGYAGTSL